MHDVLPRDLGRYTLLRLLGQGGQGQVYEAIHHGPGGLERRVALKLLRQRGDELLREARLTSLLRHPHLVDLYEVGEQDGVWFCAMELCDGSLEGRPPLSPRAVVEVGRQVCDALQYAFEELELVHLDLKPANLLVCDGSVKVADLGIAAARGFERGPLVRGTPRFMAPEQRVNGAVDARADVYALGRVLLELAAGGSEAVDATLDLDGDIEVQPFGRDARWLDELVVRCTHVDPADRPASMAALREALEALEVDGPGLVEELGGRQAPAAPVDSLQAAGPAPELVGREALLDEVEQALAHGSVHLKGPAGIGKSAVALALAHRWGPPAWWVDASGLGSEGALVALVARALEVPLRREADAERVRDALADRGRALLVLDGLPKPWPVVARWCEAAPELRVLSTGRGPGVGSSLQVPPLSVDASEALLRARALRRGVDVAGDPAVAALAARLEGVPLALALAAGRLGVLSCQEVLERLSLSWLRSGVPGRQATLRGTLDGSWDLLDPAQQAALAQLAAFRGGFTVDDVQAVLDVPDPLQAVAGLVDQSLVVVRGQRLDLLAIVREYAEEKAVDRDGVARRHAAWFARHGTRGALAAWDGPTHVRRLAERIDDLPNLAVAVERMAEAGEGVLAARAAMGAAQALRIRGPLGEGLALLDRALACAPASLRPGLWARRADLRVEAGQLAAALADLDAAASGPPDPVRATRVALCRGNRALALGELDAAAEAYAHALEVGARPGRALLCLGAVNLEAGRLDEAGAFLERAAEALRQAGERTSEAAALGNLGIVRRRQGRPDEARALYVRSLAMGEALGARASVAADRANLAILDAHAGHPEAARDHFQAAVLGFRACGMRVQEAHQVGNLAEIELHLGHVDAAGAAAERAVELAEALGSSRQRVTSLCCLARVERVRGHNPRARELLIEALAHRDDGGTPIAELLVRLELARIDVDIDPATACGWLDGLEHSACDAGVEAVARAVRGEARAANGDPDGARADIAAALASLDGLADALAVDVLCASARALGDAELYQLAVARAVGVRPGSPLEAELARARDRLAEKAL